MVAVDSVVVGLRLFERRATKGREIVFTALSLFALRIDPVERLIGRGGTVGSSSVATAAVIL